MRITVTEKWEYMDYLYWEVESLPAGWDDMDVEDKRTWVEENGEYVRVDSDPWQIIEVTDVEVQR